MSSFQRATLLTAGMLFAAACNLVTGAEGLGVDEGSDDGSDVGSETIDDLSGSGVGNGSGSGSGSSVASGSGSGGGGAGSGSSGAGGDPSTSSASTTGSGTTTAASSSSGAGAGPPTACNGIDDTNTPLDNDEQAFLVLINNYRAQNGLGALTACASLNRTAQLHSEDMRDQDYFSHTGLNNSTPWARACDACYDLGCGPSTAMAENIAAGNSGAQGTFDQWKNSPGHDANMKSPSFTQIGIGRAPGGGTYGTYWTNVFGGSTEPSCN